MIPLDFRTKLSTQASFFAGCFYIWGSLGLFGGFATFYFMPPQVGVGTSAYAALGFLHWIGGMVFFGFAALVSERHIEHAYDEEDPKQAAKAKRTVMDELLSLRKPPAA